MVRSISLIACGMALAGSLCRGQVAPVSSPFDSLRDEQFNHAVGRFYDRDETGESINEAKIEFQEIVQDHPRHAPAIAYLGMIALASDSARMADSLFRVSLLIDPSCAEAHVGRAEAYRSRELWDASLDEARLAVRLAPMSTVALWELCDELIHRPDTPLLDSSANEATPLLIKLIAINSDDQQAHLELARLYERIDDLPDAILQFREVLRIGDTRERDEDWVFSVHLDVERCLEHLGKYREAADEMGLYLDDLNKFGADAKSIAKVEARIEELREKDRNNH